MDFRELKTERLLDELNSGKLSILEEFGAFKLRRDMKTAGLVCVALANIICARKDDNKLRKRAIRILKVLFPSRSESLFVETDSSVIIGFNHPSLGEIFRLLYLGFEAYPERKFLFPVNLPWYEAMVPSFEKIQRLGICLVPMITPSTEKKLEIILDGNPDRIAEVKYIKNMMERNYMRTAADFSKRDTVIVVAPSATRQDIIIPEHIHPTMTLLAHIISRKSHAETMFLPVAIIKPSSGGRGINPFRKYGVYPAPVFSSDEVKMLSDRSRDFDLAFLKRIEEKYEEKK